MTYLFRKSGTLRPLRPHQERAIEALKNSLLTGHRRPMLQAPTGFGKTLTAAHITQAALDKGKRVAFTVPALSLVDQTVAAYAHEGITCVGVMQGYHPLTDHTQPVQVCSVQTLAKRKRPAADLVLIDEAHLMHKPILQWMADKEWADTPFIGMSATPWARGLGKHFDDLIVAARVGELIDAKYLSPFSVFAPTEPDLSSVSTVAGEFKQDELAEACDKAALVGDVVETWLKRGEDRPTLCYAVNRVHAEHLQQRFLEAGVSAAYVDCYTDRQARERIFDDFTAGRTRVICNVGTLTTGVDLDVRCIVDAKPTKSEMLFVQTIGRGLRIAPGKDKLIVLDHAGNHLRLGMVTDIHYDRLDDGEPRRAGKSKAEKAVQLPRLCDCCKAVMPREAKACPACGAVREAKSAILIRDGDLVALGARDKTKWKPTVDEKVAFFAEVRWIGQERGYSPGWAANKFKERFGEWPNDPRFRLVEPCAPSLKTKQWVRSRQIAFAKANGARVNG
jgi:DNA repair protein RadD